MSWDFSIEGGSRKKMMAKLEQGLNGGWNLKENSQKRLLADYQSKGIAATFFDNLTTCLCLECDLYVCDVLEYLEMETIFERRSKKANYAMNQLFFDWNRSFQNTRQKPERVETKDASAFLEKKELVDLVYWIEICCTILAGEKVWLSEPQKEAALLEQVILYCEPLKTQEDMQALGFDFSMHQYLKEDIEQSSFDLFYWYNSY